MFYKSEDSFLFNSTVLLEGKWLLGVTRFEVEDFVQNKKKRKQHILVLISSFSENTETFENMGKLSFLR